MSDSTRRQVAEMSVGIIAHNVALALICLVWFRTPPVFIGIAAGTVAAFLFLISMARSIELCADLADEGAARKKMTFHSTLRMLAVFLAATLLRQFTELNVLAFILAIFGVKTGAYLYPFIHKLAGQKRWRACRRNDSG